MSWDCPNNVVLCQKLQSRYVSIQCYVMWGDNALLCHITISELQAVMVLGVRNTEHRPAIQSEKKHYRAEVCHLDTIFVIGQDLHILHQIEEIHAGYAALPPGSNTSPP